mgnify:CR=1 FL=1
MYLTENILRRIQNLSFLFILWYTALTSGNSLVSKSDPVGSYPFACTKLAYTSSIVSPSGLVPFLSDFSGSLKNFVMITCLIIKR